MKSNLNSPVQSQPKRTGDTVHVRRNHVANDSTRTAKGSSIELRARRILRANFRKPGLVYPSAHAAMLPTPAPFNQRIQIPPRRTGTAASETALKNRSAVQAAELATWEATLPNTGGDLRAVAAAALEDSPAEKWAFRIISALAATGIAWGLVDSFELVQRWPQFVSALQRLLL